MNKFISLLFTIVLLMASCNKANDIKKITVASRHGDCADVGSHKCLLIQTDDDSTWTFLYEGVHDFTTNPATNMYWR